MGFHKGRTIIDARTFKARQVFQWRPSILSHCRNHDCGRWNSSAFDPVTEKVRVFPLPNDGSSSISNANLNTATFDHNAVLWFTGQSGIYGRLDPSIGRIQVFNAPSGPGPYGITTTAL